MLSVINSRMGRPFRDHELEDLVQETVLSIWKRRDKYEGLASIETWAYAFCRHHYMNRLRSRGRGPRMVGGELLDGVGASESEDHDHVRRAVDELPASERVLVNLKHFDELSFDEIGARLDLPPSTAKSRYYKALEKLRVLLGKDAKASR